MSYDTKSGKPPHRPKFVPSADQRERVRVWSAWKVPKREMARRLGIASNTFDAAFVEDLEYGAAMVEGDYEMAMHHQIMSGKAAALAVWKQAVREREWGAQKPSPAEEKKPKLGKKEQAQLDAQVPDTTDPMGELMAKYARGESPVH